MSKETSLSSILVAVRVRPFSEEEKRSLTDNLTSQLSFASQANLTTSSSRSRKGEVRKIVHALDDQVIAFDPPTTVGSVSNSRLAGKSFGGSNPQPNRDLRFAFDKVFNEDATQSDVFEGTSKDLVDEVLNGFNSTVFAYGATGCGKTHTISGTKEQPGIIFLTMEELYRRIQASEGKKEIEVSMSYLEVYNEKIRDLLIPDGVKTMSLALRENVNSGVIVSGLSEKYPKSVEEMMHLILYGNKNRTVSPTEANATSSRSHAVLQINIRQGQASALSNHYTVATLSFIDLAGSERASVTKNRADRMTEGANINRSLLALGNCINALCSNTEKQHIPYRGSKLTRLLKFSLGGNCKTVMIVCISPSSIHFDETLNTLKYANRAKNIKTKIAKNTLNVSVHISQYAKLIKELREENMALKANMASRQNKSSETLVQLDSDVSKKENNKLNELRLRLRACQLKISARDLDLKKKQYHLDIYNQRIAILQSWVNIYNKSPNTNAKGFFQSVNTLVLRLEEKRDVLSRSINFLKDSLSRTLGSQNQVMRTIMEEASNLVNPLALELLETDKELVIQEQSMSYKDFVLDDAQASSDSDLELKKQFMAYNATVLLSLKDFIGKCVAQNVNAEFLDKIYLESITLMTNSSSVLSNIPGTSSRPSTPNPITENRGIPSPSPLVDQTSQPPPSPIRHSPHHATKKPLVSALASTSKVNEPKKRVRIDALSPRPSKAFKQSLDYASTAKKNHQPQKQPAQPRGSQHTPLSSTSKYHKPSTPSVSTPSSSKLRPSSGIQVRQPISRDSTATLRKNQPHVPLKNTLLPLKTGTNSNPRSSTESSSNRSSSPLPKGSTIKIIRTASPFSKVGSRPSLPSATFTRSNNQSKAASTRLDTKLPKSNLVNSSSSPRFKARS